MVGLDLIYFFLDQLKTIITNEPMFRISYESSNVRHWNSNLFNMSNDSYSFVY